MEVLKEHLRYILFWKFCQNTATATINKIRKIYDLDIMSVSQDQK